MDASQSLEKYVTTQYLICWCQTLISLISKRLAMLRGEYANAEDGKAGERIVEFIDRILTQHE